MSNPDKSLHLRPARQREILFDRDNGRISFSGFVQPAFQEQQRGQQKPGGANPRKRYP
jgi:hypothetical protein